MKLLLPIIEEWLKGWLDDERGDEDATEAPTTVVK
jgi:hypothetical protein